MDREEGRTRCLGLDVGDRWVGVALGDPSGVLASPLTIIGRREETADLAAITAIIEEHNVGRVIVGLPYSTDGSLGPQAEKVMAFTRQLRGRTTVPVEFRDESLTTVTAQHLMREARPRRNRPPARDDAVAAALILQGYLDERG
ncbi:MAG: Holliday junction resolvase RuvX [Chloroflexota bacterium]